MACLTVTLAGEPMARAITVNCVSPGGIETAADGDPDPPKERYRDPSSTGPGVVGELGGSRPARHQRGAAVAPDRGRISGRLFRGTGSLVRHRSACRRRRGDGLRLLICRRLALTA
jgi:NAD(P)-dependent dehydrogenase (short-subunit alcohol dehydrogenase family)